MGYFCSSGSARAYLDTLSMRPSGCSSESAPLSVVPDALALHSRYNDINVIVSSHPYGLIIAADAWVR